MSTTTEKDRIQRACRRFLHLHYPQTPRDALTELGEWVDSETQADFYGAGEIITDFEREIAQILGKEAAVFMPSGTMCQQIVLRIWSDRKSIHRVAFHPQSHLELHEQHAYRFVHGLEAILMGAPGRQTTLDDLEEAPGPLAAVLLELPQRELGGLLPSWDELRAMSDWARGREIRLHLDGARLWECKPFYRREYAEIASLFDSVYVSFYKGLGGLAGAALAGPADVIDESRVWQRRHGGNLIRLYPYVVSARKGMAERLPRMQSYCDKAKEVAAVLARFEDVRLAPRSPQTNMMHVYLRGDRERLERAALEVSDETGVWLFGALKTNRSGVWPLFELAIGDAALDVSADEIKELFARLFEKARE